MQMEKNRSNLGDGSEFVCLFVCLLVFLGRKLNRQKLST